MSEQPLVTDDKSKQFRLFDIAITKGLETRALIYSEKSGEIEDRIQTCVDLRATGDHSSSANTGLTMYLTEVQVRQLGEKFIEAADTMRLVQDAQGSAGR